MPLPLTRLLTDPAALPGLPLADWDRLLPQARAAGILGRLAVMADRRGLTDMVPERPRRHLRAETMVAAKHLRDVRWEVGLVAEALRGATDRFVLLKGSAYVLADLPAAEGRLFGDVDILVPAERLPVVEAALHKAGWQPKELDPYDERYYRQYTHELPPMVHTSRGTVLDVHHTIVPRTARIALDANKLWEASRLVAPGIAVLAPADMVLHSATHLFNEGEFDRALRDLDDITRLLGHFTAADRGFPAALRARAAELDLARPLFYALRWSRRLLDGPVPESTLDGVPGLPGAATRLVMDALLGQVLRSPHPDCQTVGSAVSGFLLYVRAHHLRMPPHQVVPHLIRKAWMRLTAKDEEDEDQPPGFAAPRDRT